MNEEPEKFPDNMRGPAYFILATLFACPFMICLILSAVAHYSRQKFSFDPMITAVFLLPIFLLATICEIIFIIKAWKYGSAYYRPFLSLYAITMTMYWSAIVNVSQF
jgi:hypothetical protein